jgi:prepilin-type N-terminal cleavage/methylation domain-containing protein
MKAMVTGGVEPLEQREAKPGERSPRGRCRDPAPVSRGFTLIELLVVVAIITLLTAILLPSLQRARKQAKAVVCQSRLKQWSTILALYAEDKANIPVVLDSSWPDGGPPSANEPPPGLSRPTGLSGFCLRRHDDFVNGVFLDWSVRKIGLKELWKLKWFVDFDTNGPWTKGGGVQREDWPAWMRNMKDY